MRARRWDFISAHAAEFGVQWLCELLCVARSGYYAWRAGHVAGPSGQRGVEEGPVALAEHVRRDAAAMVPHQDGVERPTRPLRGAQLLRAVMVPHQAGAEQLSGQWPRDRRRAAAMVPHRVGAE